MPELSSADLVAAVLVLSLNAYVLLGGADFGGGVWDLVSTGPRRHRQRELIAEAIGPIWEANHVWLILAVVLLFTCFPAVFARLGVVLHLPLTLMLIGIVLRGSAFTFRTYESRDDAVQRRWGRVFAIASVITPVLLGVCIGAVASGRVGAPAPAPDFRTGYVDPWLAPFPVAVGLLALALFAFLAAVYLTVEASGESELQEDFRRRALAAGGAVFLIAWLALALAPDGAPRISRGLLGSRWALPFHLVTGAAAAGALWAVWTRRFRLARVAAAAQVSCIVWGWAASQYPYILPPGTTIRNAAAPPATLRLVLVALAVGAVVLLPSLYYLFRIFKGRGGAAFAAV
ncbi:MAG TPA: cytochrome d ubiquinol oxidase subunit II, partial [Gemmatimonadales bacterium]|nr:cytochrome d ubiquinol oxidase subunit II [Gemmatimonadales bacterium]